MSGYKRPKVRLHQEFAYLNYDTVLNALSAFEAGKVDEIIEKASEGREGGLDASLAAGPAKAGGGKKRQSTIQEELIRTRTWFSAFDAWHGHLRDHDAIGTFDSWSEEVRDEMEVGDTIEFVADVRLSPLHKLISTFLSYAKGAGSAKSPIPVDSRQAAEAKKAAAQMEPWVTGGHGRRNLLVYLLPHGVESPRLVARLDEKYVVGELDNIEGRFSVIAQVDALLGAGDKESVVRVVRDVPPTPMEIETVTSAMRGFGEAGAELGVIVSEDDLTFSTPTVIVRPIAVWK
jgi:hypothetical protein